MLLSEFNFNLPKELIAQEGLAEREKAKLMVLRKDLSIEHQHISNLPELFQKEDLLILNNTQVLQAKLIGNKESGGKVDLLVLPQLGDSKNIVSNEREVLIRGSNIQPGTKMFFKKSNESTLQAEVIERLNGARYRVQFSDAEKIEHYGILPLPPYIKKSLDAKDRYQTVYAKQKGSLAAPTAGLHFTPNLIKTLREQGVQFAEVTLHVGIGTFMPIRVEKIEDWKMHSEYYQVTPQCAQTINQAIQDQRRIFAVGTTSVRVLETVTKNKKVLEGEGWTDIFIYPGYLFKFPYHGLLTNFHLPESTLILLASAFSGKDRLFNAYQEAIAKQYRFYSLGDAMLIYP